ncbi:M20/M25/M40 family metallo-hydrolase [Caminibacter pacificus]
MREVIEIFKRITKIPHCSGNTEELKNFIIDFAKNYGYRCEVDSAGNILAKKNTPILALQSHYDMVCVGKAPDIEIIEEDGWLRAKDSSLGADNGMGVAMMLYFMKKYDNLELLFTNDEEIGLIGAFNLDLLIESPYLLNLDSEDENIYIGCAGGVDGKIAYPIKKVKKRGFFAEMEIKGLPGGHSGVDIHKNIPNAIKELAERIEIVSEFVGGERRNSIAANARAKVFYENDYADEVEVFNEGYINFINSLPHGVLEYDFEFDVVSKSINLAIINNDEIILSLRANSNEKLQEVKDYLKLKAPNVEFEGEYPAWKPEVTKLAEILRELMNTRYKVIHAGLECAVLKDKFPNISMASIGPIIENPHSVNERVKIESVEKIVSVVENLIERLNNG